MNYPNSVIECIYTRRSIRNYDDRKVPESVVKELLNAGVMAPSALNTQPWRFSIVSNKDKITEYSNIALKERGVLQNRIIRAGMKIARINSLFYNAPLLIVISGKRDYKWLYFDISICAQNMFLAAKSLGLGSCFIGYAKILDNNQKVKDELGIPIDHEIVATLIFGYPKVSKEVPKRRVRILKWIK